MAGPWFTVQKSGGDFEKMGQVWISDGHDDAKGFIEIRVELAEPRAGDWPVLSRAGPGANHNTGE